MNEVVIAIPLVAAGCFGVLGPLAAVRLPPRQATWLLTIGGTVLALSGLVVLSLLASVLLAQVPDVASEGHWSAVTLHEHSPVDRDIGFLALLVLFLSGMAICVVAYRRGSALLTAHRICRALPSGAGGLVVVTDTNAGAVAVPGAPGRIVVAQSLLMALSGAERRALLAHERAHLKHRHHLHLMVISLAAAANPFLIWLRAAAAHACERWADEEAAAEVGERRLVAAAVAQAALMTKRRPGVAPMQLAAAAHAVPQRVAALLDHEPESRPELLVIAAALLIAGVVAVVMVGKDTEHLFEFAGKAYSAAHGP